MYMRIKSDLLFSNMNSWRNMFLFLSELSFNVCQQTALPTFMNISANASSPLYNLSPVYPTWPRRITLRKVKNPQPRCDICHRFNPVLSFEVLHLNLLGFNSWSILFAQTWSWNPRNCIVCATIAALSTPPQSASKKFHNARAICQFASLLFLPLHSWYGVRRLFVTWRMGPVVEIIRRCRVMLLVVVKMRISRLSMWSSLQTL